MEAPAGILPQAFFQQFPNLHRCRIGKRLPVRLALKDLRDTVGDCLSREQLPARQRLVKHAAERPDVGSLIDWFSPRLLRAHVRGSSEDLPRPCRACSELRGNAFRSSEGSVFCKTKVEQLDLSLRCDLRSEEHTSELQSLRH